MFEPSISGLLRTSNIYFCSLLCIYTDLFPIEYRNFVLIYLHSLPIFFVLYCHICYIYIFYKPNNTISITITLYIIISFKEVKKNEKNLCMYRFCYMHFLIYLFWLSLFLLLVLFLYFSIIMFPSPSFVLLLSYILQFCMLCI